MNLINMLKKLPSLDGHQLLQAKQAQEIQITNYTRAIANYPPERMEKYGQPFMEKLKGELARINAEIARRG